MSPSLAEFDHVTCFISLHLKTNAMLKLKGVFVIFFPNKPYNYVLLGAFKYIPKNTGGDR